MDKKRNMINEIYEITDIIRKHISRNKASVDDDEVMEIIEKYVFTRQELAFRDYEETLHIINRWIIPIYIFINAIFSNFFFSIVFA